MQLERTLASLTWAPTPYATIWVLTLRGRFEYKQLVKHWVVHSGKSKGLLWCLWLKCFLLKYRSLPQEYRLHAARLSFSIKYCYGVSAMNKYLIICLSWFDKASSLRNIFHVCPNHESDLFIYLHAIFFCHFAFKKREATVCYILFKNKKISTNIKKPWQLWPCLYLLSSRWMMSTFGSTTGICNSCWRKQKQ